MRWLLRELQEWRWLLRATWWRLGQMSARLRLWRVLLVSAGAAALGTLLLWGPERMVQWVGAGRSPDYAKLVDEYRRTLAQVIGGFGAIILVWLAWRRTVATEDGQITDRFSEAIDHIGDRKSLAKRLGGIYALERIAKDSFKDHWGVIEVLTAFVRENAPITQAPVEETEVPTDVQAVLTVLGRRKPAWRAREKHALDLSRVSVRGANLREAHLDGADFTAAHLHDADLRKVHLEGATLREAHMHNADLREARLDGAKLPLAQLFCAKLMGAKLGGANLMGANLIGAKLMGAELGGAKLEGAHLGGADLSHAVGLTCEMLAHAVIDSKTVLPDYLRDKDERTGAAASK